MVGLRVPGRTFWGFKNLPFIFPNQVLGSGPFNGKNMILKLRLRLELSLSKRCFFGPKIFDRIVSSITKKICVLSCIVL